jgi:hypothetical protein
MMIDELFGVDVVVVGAVAVVWLVSAILQERSFLVLNVIQP